MKTKIGFITWVVCIVIACNTQPKGVKVKLVNDMPNYEIIKIAIGTSYYLGKNDSLHHQEFRFNCNLKKQQDTVITFKYFNKNIVGMDVYFTNNIDTIITVKRADSYSNQTIDYGSFAYLLSFYEKQVAVNDKGMKVVGLNFKIEKGE